MRSVSQLSDLLKKRNSLDEQRFSLSKQQASLSEQIGELDEKILAEAMPRELPGSPPYAIHIGNWSISIWEDGLGNRYVASVTPVIQVRNSKGIWAWIKGGGI